jgi:hypothetical protein
VVRRRGDGKKCFNGHMVRKRGDEISFSDCVIGKGVMKTLATMWLGDDMTEKNFSDYVVRRRGDEKGCCWVG